MPALPVISGSPFMVTTWHQGNQGHFLGAPLSLIPEFRNSLFLEFPRKAQGRQAGNLSSRRGRKMTQGREKSMMFRLSHHGGQPHWQRSNYMTGKEAVKKGWKGQSNIQYTKYISYIYHTHTHTQVLASAPKKEGDRRKGKLCLSVLGRRQSGRPKVGQQQKSLELGEKSTSSH